MNLSGAPVLAGELDGRAYRVGVAHVGPGKQPANLVGQRLAALFVEVRDHDLAASGGEISDCSLPEAARPSGHDCGGSVNFHGRSILRPGHLHRMGFGKRRALPRSAF